MEKDTGGRKWRVNQELNWETIVDTGEPWWLAIVHVVKEL